MFVLLFIFSVYCSLCVIFQFFILFIFDCCKLTNFYVNSSSKMSSNSNWLDVSTRHFNSRRSYDAFNLCNSPLRRGEWHSQRISRIISQKPWGSVLRRELKVKKGFSCYLCITRPNGVTFRRRDTRGVRCTYHRNGVLLGDRGDGGLELIVRVSSPGELCVYIIPGDADIFQNEARAPITRSPTRYVYLTSNTTASCYARTHAETLRQERERERERQGGRERVSLRVPWDSVSWRWRSK